MQKKGEARAREEISSRLHQYRHCRHRPETGPSGGRAYPTRRRSSGGAWRSCCRRLVQPWSTIRSPRPTSSPWPPGRGSGAEWRRRYRPPNEEINAGANIVIGPPSHKTIALWAEPCSLLLTIHHLLVSGVYPAQEGELHGGQGADQVQPHVQARPVRVGLLPVNNITTCDHMDNR